MPHNFYFLKLLFDTQSIIASVFDRILRWCQPSLVHCADDISYVKRCFIFLNCVHDCHYLWFLQKWVPLYNDLSSFFFLKSSLSLSIIYLDWYHLSIYHLSFFIYLCIYHLSISHLSSQLLLINYLSIYLSVFTNWLIVLESSTANRLAVTVVPQGYSVHKHTTTCSALAVRALC